MLHDWDTFFDMIALGLIVWGLVALATGILIGLSIRQADVREGTSDRPEDTNTHARGDDVQHIDTRV